MTDSNAPTPLDRSQRIIIAEAPMNAVDSWRLELKTYKGTPVFDLRRWSRPNDRPAEPTERGFMADVRHLNAIRDAFIAAADRLKAERQA